MASLIAVLHESPTIKMLRQSNMRGSPAGWKLVTHGFMEGKYIEFNFHEGKLIEKEASDGNESVCSLEKPELPNNHSSVKWSDFKQIDDAIIPEDRLEDLRNRAITLLSSISLSELESPLLREKPPIYSPDVGDAVTHSPAFRMSECHKVSKDYRAKHIGSPVYHCSLAYEQDLKSSSFLGPLKSSSNLLPDHRMNNTDFESKIGSVEHLKRQWSALKQDPITSSDSTYSRGCIRSSCNFTLEENSQHSTDREFSSKSSTTECRSEVQLTPVSIKRKESRRNASPDIKSPGTPRRCSATSSPCKNANSQGILKKSSVFYAKRCSSPAWSWKSPVHTTKKLIAQHSESTTSDGKVFHNYSPFYSQLSSSSVTSGSQNTDAYSTSSTCKPHHISRSDLDSELHLPDATKVGCLPVHRFAQGSGKLSLFAPRQIEEASKYSLTSCPEDPNTVVRGHIHCLVKDGVPNYTFLIKGSDKALVARSWRLGPSKQDSAYAFYSWKQKGKNLVSWKNLKRRDEKLASHFLGKMTIIRKVIKEEKKHTSATGQRTFVNLEFVLLKENTNEQEIDLSSLCSPRDSSSSCDSTAYRWHDHPGTKLSPSPSFFHLLSPPSTSTGLPSPGSTATFLSPTTLAARRTTTLLADARKIENLGRSPQSQCSPVSFVDRGLPSPFSSVYKNPLHSLVADNSSDGHLEYAGIIIKIPIETLKSTSLADALNQDCSRGWGWSFVRKKTHFETNNSLSKANLLQNNRQQKEVCTSNDCQETLKPNCKEKPICKKELSAVLGNSKPKGKENVGNNSSCLPAERDDVKKQVDVTIILPAGEHGRPFYGVSGPQPLIERWQHGGRCDCESWDLGCGLSILHAKLSDKSAESSKSEKRSSTENEAEDRSLTVLLQGAKEQQAVMSLTPLHNGLCSLSFQAPLSAFQAFASAVAILYSMEPNADHNNLGIQTESVKPSRIPFKPLENCQRFN